MVEITPVRLAILSFVTLAAGLLIWKFRPRTVSEKRAVRQSAVVEIAPLPITDSTTPLVGVAGTDPFGYPTQYVDGEVLRAMLVRGKFEDLTRYFEQFEDAFEKDSLTEYWIGDAGSAFSTSEPGILPKLDAWVAATPSSFAPYLARGMHWKAVAGARRGGKLIKDTPQADLRAMEEALQISRADLHRALAIRPRATEATISLMAEEAWSGSREEFERLAAKAIARCPKCFHVRVSYIELSVPKWGGSYQEMEQIADDAAKVDNPKLKLLPGYIDLDKSNQTLVANGADNAKALALLDHACGLGDDGDFLLDRSYVHERMGNTAAAKADLDRAIQLRPKVPAFLAARAYFHLRYSRDYEAAARDELAALRLNPTNGRAKEDYADVVQGVVYLGEQTHKAGNDKEALRILDLGAELAPSSTEVQRSRAWILSGGEKGSGEGVALASARDGGIPDDIDEVRKMDYALAREKRFAEIVPIWDAYIAKHPDDGRAYLERGGTYFNLGKQEESGNDARKACDLGVNEGCLRARQLGK